MYIMGLKVFERIIERLTSLSGELSHFFPVVQLLFEFSPKDCHTVRLSNTAGRFCFVKSTGGYKLLSRKSNF